MAVKYTKTQELIARIYSFEITRKPDDIFLTNVIKDMDITWACACNLLRDLVDCGLADCDIDPRYRTIRLIKLTDTGRKYGKSCQVLIESLRK